MCSTKVGLRNVIF
ncbi:unnamed protein product, partial [Allacma fusca]